MFTLTSDAKRECDGNERESGHYRDSPDGFLSVLRTAQRGSEGQV